MTQQASIEGRVQECGCIALPQALQLQTGLYPGATYTLEIAESGTAILLRIVQPAQQAESNLGASCG